jgi:hypothetical protein
MLDFLKKTAILRIAEAIASRFMRQYSVQAAAPTKHSAPQGSLLGREAASHIAALSTALPTKPARSGNPAQKSRQAEQQETRQRETVGRKPLEELYLKRSRVSGR